MKIIMVKGNSDSHKTTTINLVYFQLLQLGATVIAPRTQVGGQLFDFECILEYNDKKIAFFSMGDDYAPVAAALQKYNQLGCDWLIMANSNKRYIPGEVLRYDPSPVIIDKYKPEEIDLQDKDKIISHL